MGLVQSVVQSVLSGTTITLNNATMLPCAGLAAELQNHMEIHIPLNPLGVPTLDLLGVTLYSFNMTMTSEVCAPGGGCQDTDLGTFEAPITRNLNFGKNKADWDVGIKLLDAGSLLNSFIVPMFAENKTVTLKLSADDVALDLRFVVLPLIFKNLKLEKRLTCSAVGLTDQHAIADKFCHPSVNAGGRRLDTSQGYTIKCVPTSADIIV